jgi:hypothetical protein
MFLSPLGERLGEGVNPKIVSCITPSPSLSPTGERNMKGEEHEVEVEGQHLRWERATPVGAHAV